MRKKNNIDDLIITNDGILNTSETVSINVNDKRATYEMCHSFLGKMGHSFFKERERFLIIIWWRVIMHTECSKVLD